MHTKTETNTEPHKQWEVDKTINQQQQNHSLLESKHHGGKRWLHSKFHIIQFK